MRAALAVAAVACLAVAAPPPPPPPPSKGGANKDEISPASKNAEGGGGGGSLDLDFHRLNMRKGAANSRIKNSENISKNIFHRLLGRGGGAAGAPADQGRPLHVRLCAGGVPGRVLAGAGAGSLQHLLSQVRYLLFPQKKLFFARLKLFPGVGTPFGSIRGCRGESSLIEIFFYFLPVSN